MITRLVTLVEQSQFLPELVSSRTQAHSRVQAVRSPAAGGDGRVLGQGDHDEPLGSLKSARFCSARCSLRFQTEGSITAVDHEAYVESGRAQNLGAETSTPRAPGWLQGAPTAQPNCGIFPRLTRNGF